MLVSAGPSFQICGIGNTIGRAVGEKPHSTQNLPAEVLSAMAWFRQLSGRNQAYSSSSLSSGASVGLENSMRYPSGSVSGTTQRRFPTDGRFSV